PLEIAITWPRFGYATCCGAGTGFGVGRVSITGNALPPPASRFPPPASAMSRNLQDLPSLSEYAIAHVIKSAGNQRPGRARVSSAAEPACERVDVHPACAPE